ncbi:retrotransposon protein [Cucumis melo var. makuwa]|uniref:Retrotransposon protein n=1 Tax=Cucumis melo var. makuwa TaxID=1194695 RepID=A0A5D3CKW5_CUCMM|nr:retrotransposon protein [Cucumis melo var. makuwa]TYK11788.1 retrotransposon protein [Cucumis melo var. makuwa]
MTYCNDVNDVDEGDSTYSTTTASEDIQYIETTNEWSQWRDKLVESMFTDWQMSTSNRAPRHVWTKEEEEGTLVECLMELVTIWDGNRIMVRSGQVTLPSWPSPKCVGQCAVALGGTMKRNVSLRRKNYLIIGLG